MSRSKSPAKRRADGANLYQIEPSSKEHEKMIEEGRRVWRTAVANALSCDVSFREVVAEGDTLYDKFLVRCNEPGGFTPQLSNELESRSSRTQPGESALMRIAFVSHRHYDSRVACFDLSKTQMCLVLLLFQTALALAYGAHLLHQVSHGQQTLSDWLGYSDEIPNMV